MIELSGYAALTRPTSTGQGGVGVDPHGSSLLAGGRSGRRLRPRVGTGVRRHSRARTGFLSIRDGLDNGLRIAFNHFEQHSSGTSRRTKALFPMAQCTQRNAESGAETLLAHPGFDTNCFHINWLRTMYLGLPRISSDMGYCVVQPLGNFIECLAHFSFSRRPPAV